MTPKKSNQFKLYQSQKKLKNHIITTLEHIGFNRFLKRRKEPFTSEDFALHLIDILDALQDYNRELSKMELMSSAMKKNELDRFADSLSDLVYGYLDELKFHTLQIGPFLSLLEDFIKDEKMEAPDLVEGVWFEKVKEKHAKLSRKKAQARMARFQSIFAQFDFKESDILKKQLIKLSQESPLVINTLKKFVKTLEIKCAEESLSSTNQTVLRLYNILPSVLISQELCRKLLYLV